MISNVRSHVSSNAIPNVIFNVRFNVRFNARFNVISNVRFKFKISRGPDRDLSKLSSRDFVGFTGLSKSVDVNTMR